MPRCAGVEPRNGLFTSVLRHLRHPGDGLWKKDCRGVAHMTARERRGLDPPCPATGTCRRSGAAKRRSPMISGQEHRGFEGYADRHRTACHPTNCVHHRHGPSTHRNFRGKAGTKPLLVANRHRRTISPYSGSIGQGVTATLQSKFERRKGDYIATRPCFTRSRSRRSTRSSPRSAAFSCYRGGRTQSRSQIASLNSRPRRWCSSASSPA
jgi:hypothetical protein